MAASINQKLGNSNTDQESDNESTDQESASCNICRRNFKDNKLLKSHHDKHHYIRKCPNCNKNYLQTRKFVKHLRTHINDCPYVCKFCLNSFNGKAFLRMHMVEHTNKDMKMCRVCTEKYKSHSDLIKHMATHGKRPYKCPRCNTAFSYAPNLVTHLKNHITRCEVCKVPMKDRWALLYHIDEVHRTKKKELCPELVPRNLLKYPDAVLRADCDSSDSMAESSSSDEDSDSSSCWEENNANIDSVYNVKHEMGFICFICLQLCPSSELLKYHMKAHTWFPCPHCPKFFVHNQDLNIHKMESHSHPCTQCNTVFECENDLNLHKQKCSLNFNLTSVIKDVVQVALENKKCNIEEELDRKLKEMEKDMGGSYKISIVFEKSSNNEEDGEDLFF
ncbi:zinc finger protein 569 [Trichonephila inaurata madagascariensis]|uniref:Zinc finger protein 569 n=1 Tax=Trichonephila inaurata madagascariensis TaxID=2747483 RepID=A0A8X6YVM9_9ARAC|nr:zinc finger protein 569 [Trichonephila inaurata madagascariensis]